MKCMNNFTSLFGCLGMALLPEAIKKGNDLWRRGESGAQVRKMRSQVSWTSPKSWKARFEKKNMKFSKVVSTHLWNTTLNLYQPSIKGFLS